MYSTVILYSSLSLLLVYYYSLQIFFFYSSHNFNNMPIVFYNESNTYTCCILLICILYYSLVLYCINLGLSIPGIKIHSIINLAITAVILLFSMLSILGTFSYYYYIVLISFFKYTSSTLLIYFSTLLLNLNISVVALLFLLHIFCYIICMDLDMYSGKLYVIHLVVLYMLYIFFLSSVYDFNFIKLGSVNTSCVNNIYCGSYFTLSIFKLESYVFYYFTSTPIYMLYSIYILEHDCKTMPFIFLTNSNFNNSYFSYNWWIHLLNININYCNFIIVHYVFLFFFILFTL